MSVRITDEAPHEFDGFCPVAPVPKGRPRFTRNGIAYTPKPTREYETAVRNWAKEAYGIHTAPMDGTLGARFEFLLPRPKSAPSQAWYSNKKPDTDNFVKGFLDALDFKLKADDGTELGVLANDSRVATITAMKRYSAGETGTRVTIFHADETVVLTDGAEQMTGILDPTIRHIGYDELTGMKPMRGVVEAYMTPMFAHGLSVYDLVTEKLPNAEIVTL